MNTLEKIWCRSFQKTMHTAIPLLPYRKPEILNSVEQIPEKMRESGCRQALLVTDRSIRLHGLTRRLEQALSGAGIGVSVFETIANPTTDVIEEAVSLYRRTRCDTLIGFGGGSSMDTAKAVGALTHAVEAYIGRSTTAETEREALTAVRLIFRYLEQAYRNGATCPPVNRRSWPPSLRETPSPNPMWDMYMQSPTHWAENTTHLMVSPMQ